MSLQTNSSSASRPTTDIVDVMQAFTQKLMLSPAARDDFAMDLSQHYRTERDILMETLQRSCQTDKITKRVAFLDLIPPGEVPVLYASLVNADNECVYLSDEAGITASNLLNCDELVIAGSVSELPMPITGEKYTIVEDVAIEAWKDRLGSPILLSFNGGRQAGTFCFSIDTAASVRKCRFLFNVGGLKVGRK